MRKIFSKNRIFQLLDYNKSFWSSVTRGKNDWWSIIISGSEVVCLLINNASELQISHFFSTKKRLIFFCFISTQKRLWVLMFYGEIYQFFFVENENHLIRSHNWKKCHVLFSGKNNRTHFVYFPLGLLKVKLYFQRHTWFCVTKGTNFLARLVLAENNSIPYKDIESVLSTIYYRD